MKPVEQTPEEALEALRETVLNTPANPPSVELLIEMLYVVNRGNWRDERLAALDNRGPSFMSYGTLNISSLREGIKEAATRAEGRLVTHLAVTGEVLAELQRDSAIGQVYDPCSNIDTLASGYLGSLVMGPLVTLQVVTDAFFNPVLRYLGPWKWAIYSAPEIV